MSKIKTIDEFFIERYEKLEKENEELRNKNYNLECSNANLTVENNILISQYNELVSNIKKDFEIKLKDTSIQTKPLFIWHTDENFEYYKNVFNLKEENEKEEENVNDSYCYNHSKILEKERFEKYYNEEEGEKDNE